MQIHQIVQGNTRVFLIEQSDKIFLVDAGLKGKSGLVFDMIAEIGHSPEDVAFIVITHAHYDHTGGLAEIEARAKCEIICQKLEAEPLSKGKNASLKINNRFLDAFARPLMEKQKIQPIRPSITYDGSYNLAAFGIDGRIIHTPGHTHGSSSIVLGKDIAIIGDIAMQLFGLRLTPITYDKEILKNSLRKLLDMNIQNFYITHGGFKTREQLESLLD